MGVRPSEVYGIRDEFRAFCFDRAVVTFGKAMEADIKEAVGKSKTQAGAKMAASRRISRWLDDDPDKPLKGLYRDPARR